MKEIINTLLQAADAQGISIQCLQGRRPVGRAEAQAGW
jgi:hypothetical protein